MIEGYPKASLSEITFEPGSSFGPVTMKNPMICEITAAPLEQHIEGQSPRMLQPGAPPESRPSTERDRAAT
jgi:hypothetical protein